MSKRNVINDEYASFNIKIKVAGNEHLIAQCKRLASEKKLTTVFKKAVRESSKQMELPI